MLIGSHPLGIGARLRQDRPHEPPPGGGAAVGDVEDPGPPVESEGHDGRGQVGREGRRPVLVVDEAQLAVAAAGQAQRGHDHVGAVGAAHPARPHDGRPGSALALARQLGGAVDRRRARCVPLPVGPGAGAVEDVVGRHVDHVRAHQRRRLGHVAGADGVHGVGEVDLGLAAIDRGERATVEDELGSEGGEGRQDGVTVVDRHGVDVGAQHLVLQTRPGALGAEQRTAAAAGRHSPRQAVEQVTAQLPVRPGDEDPHRSAGPGSPQAPSAMGARARSGSHQSRCAAYQATVSASPCSHSTDGAQPSSVRSLEESST